MKRREFILKSTFAGLALTSAAPLLGIKIAEAAPDADDGTPVLHYNFPSDPGTLAKDISGHGNEGKIVNAQWLPEVNGRRGVLRFDGKSSYIDCGNKPVLHIDGDMSFEMWVRMNSPLKDAQWGDIFDAPNGFQFTTAYYNSDVLLYYRNPGDSREMMVMPVTHTVLSAEWSHIAVVMEYPRCRFYCNGKLVGDLFMPIPGVAGNLQTGAKLIGGNKKASFCPMDISDFRLYNRALTPQEIAAHARDQEIEPPRNTELAVEPDWYKNILTLRLICKNAGYDKQKVSFSLLSNDKAVASQNEVFGAVFSNDVTRLVAIATLPLESFSGQTLQTVARVEGTDVEAAQTVTLDKPDWIHTKAGYSEKVLSPWTPVQTKATSNNVQVGVWGRQYDFGSLPLMRQIETKKADILAASMSISGQVDGKKIVWENGLIELKSTSAIAADLEQAAQSNGITFHANSHIEYDGYTIIECMLKADRDVSIDNLNLEIPLKTQYAKFCYADRVLPLKPGNPFSEWYSGAVQGDFSFRFSSNIWLGNEDLGLTWQAESDQDWHYTDPQKAIEILPRGDSTFFLAHWIDQPLQLRAGQTLRYKFALLATPMKPMVHDAWDLRIARSEPYGADFKLPGRKINGEPALRYYKKIGIRNLFTNVNDVWPWPLPVHQQFSAALHQLIDAAHHEDLHVYPYLIHQRFPVNVPEFNVYGLNMANRPLKQYVQYAYPGAERPGPVSVDYGADSQGTIFMCPQSEALQDAYIHSLAQRLQEYGDDGIYLDGTVHIVPCENLDHGCGYQGSDGKIHSTYPVFGVRAFMKRIYTVVKEQNPDNIVDVHCSWGYNPGGLAYADCLWTGEQWHQLAQTGVPGGYVSGTLSLDQFRTEFMGYQLGVAAEMLTYRLGGDNMKCAAISLLHDISPRLSTNGSDDPGTPYDPYYSLVPKLWQMREDFDTGHAQKYFYWNNADYVTVTPEKCYATLLQHPQNGVLALISNLSPVPQNVTVQLHLDKLGLNNRNLRVFNPLTKETIPLSAGGQMSIPLNSESWIYVWLQPQNA